MDTFFRRLARRRLKVRMMGIAAVAMLAGIAAWWLHADSASDRAASAADAAAPAITALLEGVGLAEPLRELVIEPAAPQWPSMPPERAELCGVGWVMAKADGSVDESALSEVATRLAPARQRLIDVMGDADEWGRAVALWLRALDLQRQGAAAPSTACQDEACAAEARQRAVDGAEVIQQIAQQAATTADPRIYALAFKSCGANPLGGSCALLSTAQWARLDAENAEPWLFVLDDATRRKDRALIDESLHRIGTAARFDARFFAVTGLIAEHADEDDIGKLAAHFLAVEALGTAAAQTLPLQALSNACGPAAIRDANRRQECDAAAATLAERSDSLLIAMLGASLGHRLDWPTERVAMIRSLAAANVESLPFDPLVGNEYSCANLKLLGQRFIRQAQVGEVQFARDWIASKGMTLDAYARLQEERRLQAAAAAPALAVAASAAASAVADAKVEPSRAR